MVQVCVSLDEGSLNGWLRLLVIEKLLELATVLGLILELSTHLGL